MFENYLHKTTKPWCGNLFCRTWWGIIILSYHSLLFSLPFACCWSNFWIHFNRLNVWVLAGMEEIKGADVQGIKGNVDQGRLAELQTQLLAVAVEVKKVHVELEKMSSKRLWNWTTKFKKRSLRQQSGWLIQRQMALQSEVTQLQMALQSRVTQLQITQGFTKLRLELALQREEMRLELALHREEMRSMLEEMRSMLAEMAKMFAEVRLFSQIAIMSYFEPVMTVTSNTKRYRDGLFSAYGLNPSSTTFRCFLTGMFVTIELNMSVCFLLVQ